MQSHAIFVLSKNYQMPLLKDICSIVHAILSPFLWKVTWHDQRFENVYMNQTISSKESKYQNDIIFCTFQHFVMPQIYWQHLYFQVSSMKCGLLYLSQESCLIGDVSYHNYEGLVVEKAEWESLSRDLGVHNKVMLLRNHGKSWFKRNFNKYVKSQRRFNLRLYSHAFKAIFSLIS